MIKKQRIAFLLLALIIIVASCSRKSSDAKNQLTLSIESVHFPATGGSKQVSVLSNSGWDVSDTSWWCATTPTRGQGDQNFTITVQANTQTIQRMSTVFVKVGTLTREVKVTQDAFIPTDPDTNGAADSIPPDQTDMRNMDALALVAEMKVGWNVGNSLEATGSETAWGNPMISEQLIDSIHKAGFNAVRIPVAWSRFTNASSYKIDTAWMKRVEQVVNYVLKNNMYAIMNMHWDGGWMQPTYATQNTVNARITAMWKQIAVRFRNYGDHLVFAGSNEVMVDGDYGTPTAEYYTVQNSFNQTFVKAVRSTGGRNAYRHLAVQGFNTNIDYTSNFFVLPTDPATKKLMVEVHYYDPYNFTLNMNSSITQWGSQATDPAKTETWANETYADAQFQKMKAKFIDQGIPVILGEYAASARLELGSPAANADHAKFRALYTAYITKSASAHGIIPFYWDSGFTGNGGSGIFDRTSGAVVYPEILKALISP
jgi:endoglucanase